MTCTPKTRCPILLLWWFILAAKTGWWSLKWFYWNSQLVITRVGRRYWNMGWGGNVQGSRHLDDGMARTDECQETAGRNHMINDKAGWDTEGLTDEAGWGLKQAGRLNRETQAGSDRGQAGSSMGVQAGKHCEVLQKNKERCGQHLVWDRNWHGDWRWDQGIVTWSKTQNFDTFIVLQVYTFMHWPQVA